MRLSTTAPKQLLCSQEDSPFFRLSLQPCCSLASLLSASSFALPYANMTSPLPRLKPCHGSTVHSAISQHGVTQPCFPLQLHCSALCVTFNPQPHNPVSGPLTLAHAVPSS